MKTIVVEIRDSGTFIPALAMRMAPDQPFFMAYCDECFAQTGTAAHLRKQAADTQRQTYGAGIAHAEELDALREEVEPIRRAHRVEVDTCDQCPWGRGQQFCQHPSPTVPKGVCDPRGGPFTVPYPEPAPKWCPLRGAVTLVAGPRIATENEDSRKRRPTGGIMPSRRASNRHHTSECPPRDWHRRRAWPNLLGGPT